VAPRAVQVAQVDLSPLACEEGDRSGDDRGGQNDLAELPELEPDYLAPSGRLAHEEPCDLVVQHRLGLFLDCCAHETWISLL
jgi:hypothetical protein